MQSWWHLVAIFPLPITRTWFHFAYLFIQSPEVMHQALSFPIIFLLHLFTYISNVRSKNENHVVKSSCCWPTAALLSNYLICIQTQILYLEFLLLDISTCKPTKTAAFMTTQKPAYLYKGKGAYLFHTKNSSINWPIYILFTELTKQLNVSV